MNSLIILAVLAQATLHIQVNVVDVVQSPPVVQAAPVYIPMPSSMDSRLALVNIRGVQVQLTTVTLK